MVQRGALPVRKSEGSNPSVVKITFFVGKGFYFILCRNGLFIQFILSVYLFIHSFMTTHQFNSSLYFEREKERERLFVGISLSPTRKQKNQNIYIIHRYLGLKKNPYIHTYVRS